MKRIYLYLFLFSLIINIFQYVNDSKILKDQQQHIERLERKLQKQQDSLNTAIKSQPVTPQNT